MKNLKKGLSKGVGKFLVFLDSFDKDIYFKLELKITEPRKEKYYPKNNSRVYKK